jgi:hypothetical protein
MLRMVRAFAPVLAKNGGGAIANMLSVVSWFVFTGGPDGCPQCLPRFRTLVSLERSGRGDEECEIVRMTAAN